MALYRYPQFLGQSEEAVFDNIYKPSELAPCSGIYRCEGCGREVASNQREPLPPQNHHQHNYQHGAVRWRLIVAADHRGR
jgi:hypothetical protein